MIFCDESCVKKKSARTDGSANELNVYKPLQHPSNFDGINRSRYLLTFIDDFFYMYLIVCFKGQKPF